MSTNTPLRIIPFPDDSKLNSNKFIVNTAIYDKNDYYSSYNHIGTYVISSSSYSDDSHQPYNVFNNGVNTSWKTNYKGNTYKYKTTVQNYTQNPYYNNNNFDSLNIYQGGGLPQTTYTTMVDNVGYNGEWIQVQLPLDNNPIFLFKYTITTPYNNINTFPKTFLVVGSNDGSNWHYLDFQKLPLITNEKKSSTKTFNVNTTESYLYFRFVFLELFPSNSVLEINEIKIIGLVDTTVNPDAVSETFTDMKYSNYSLSSILPEETMKTSLQSSIFERESQNLNTYLNLFLFLGFSGSLYFYVQKK